MGIFTQNLGIFGKNNLATLQLTFAEEEKKKERTERTKRTKSNKKEKVRTAFLPWIPKGVLRTQQSNFVYSTKLQQKLLHSTTLLALVQLQIHCRGIRAMVNPGSLGVIVQCK